MANTVVFVGSAMRLRGGRKKYKAGPVALEVLHHNRVGNPFQSGPLLGQAKEHRLESPVDMGLRGSRSLCAGQRVAKGSSASSDVMPWGRGWTDREYGDKSESPLGCKARSLICHLTRISM